VLTQDDLRYGGAEVLACSQAFHPFT